MTFEKLDGELQPILQKWSGPYTDRIAALEAQLNTLSAFTTHGVSCNIRGSGPGECTCGLDDALDSSL